MVFMDVSFENLCKFSDVFNVSPFILVVMSTAITHYSLLTLLQVNVSYIPLQIFLSPLTSNATAVSGQMALLSYIAQQSVAVQEKQSQLKPMPGAGKGKVDPNLESDNGSTSSKVQHNLLQEETGLMPSKKG